MVDFAASASAVMLTYRADQADNGWVWRKLRDDGEVTLSHVFIFERRDLVAEPEEDDAENDYDDFEYRFRFAIRRDGYLHIEGRILGIDNPVLIAEANLRLERKVFVAERNISIFGKIAELIPPASRSSSAARGPALYRRWCDGLASWRAASASIGEAQTAHRCFPIFRSRRGSCSLQNPCRHCGVQICQFSCRRERLRLPWQHA